MVGGVKRLTLAVVINYALNNVGGEVSEERVPRSKEEMDKLRELLIAASGYDSSRGDVLKIENILFSQISGTGLVTSFETEEKRDFWLSIVKYGVSALIVFLIISAVIRPGVKAMGVLVKGLPPIGSVKRLPPPYKAYDTDVYQDGLAARGDLMRDKLQEVLVKDPDALVRVIKEWMNETRNH
jgi:flagellar M-ring protein FliF